jgi:hypothetical protein
MEEFERELGDMSISKPKKKKEVKIADDEDEEDVPDGADFEDLDETELGYNPFAMGAGGSAVAGSIDTEPWLGSDRDYTYQEVHLYPSSSLLSRHTDMNLCLTAPESLLSLPPCCKPCSRPLRFETIHPRPTLDPQGRQQALRIAVGQNALQRRCRMR